MNKIGSLGPVVFVVSDEATRTIEDFNRSSAGRFARHDIIGRKPKLEFLGPGADSVTFRMTFAPIYRLNPRKEMDRLTELERAGKALPLVIGGKGVGQSGLWVITDLSQSWDVLDHRGNVLSSSVDISLEEYVK